MVVSFSKVSNANKAKLIETFILKGELKESDIEIFTENQKSVLRSAGSLEKLKEILEIPMEDAPPTIKEKLKGRFLTLGILSVKEIDSYMSTYIGKNIEPKWIDFLIHNVLLTSEVEFLRNNKKSRFTRSQLREFYRAIAGNPEGNKEKDSK